MDKKVRIIGVPLDLGAKKLGVDMGPTFIRYANLEQAFIYNNIQVEDEGNIPIERSGKPDPDSIMHARKVISQVSEKLSEITYKALTEGYIPVVLGGDHSSAIGSIAGVSKKAKRMGLLWFDAHPDSNTPETSPSGNIHGMTVAISMGYGYPELVDCAGFSPKIRPEDICMIGINNIDEGEKELLTKLGVKMFTLMDIEKYGISNVMDDAVKIVTKHTDTVHVSFDVDALEPEIAPGTGILSRGGLNYREILYAMKYLGHENIVSSMDIIEVNPVLDVKNTTAELVIELLMAALGGVFGDYERNYLEEQTK